MGPTNAAIADRLVLFAGLLELADANPYAARAYRRAADVIRSTPAPVAELVRSGRVRDLSGIGSGIEERLRELVETGEIAELRDLEARVEPELIGFGRLLGLGAKRISEIGRALGVSTAADFRAAVEDGRLRMVPGVGPATESKIRAGLEREPRARRGLTLNRSRPLTKAIADALGGDSAGEARRFCELSYELAVVCAASEPRATLAQFEELPLIVSVLERGERRAVGVTVEGVPVTLVVAEPSRFGTELLRATGSPYSVLRELDWVQISLHAGQRRAGPELTRVVIEAMKNPYVRALSHPKGRILNHRPENALDLDEVFRIAEDRGVALEVNGLPDRLDLSGTHVSEAVAAGVDVVLGRAFRRRPRQPRSLGRDCTTRRGRRERSSQLSKRRRAHLIGTGPTLVRTRSWESRYPPVLAESPAGPCLQARGTSP